MIASDGRVLVFCEVKTRVARDTRRDPLRIESIPANANRSAGSADPMARSAPEPSARSRPEV